MLTSRAIFFMNFLPEKKYGVPSHNYVKKNVLSEKGDEITRFDGTLQHPTKPYLRQHDLLSCTDTMKSFSDNLFAVLSLGKQNSLYETTDVLF
jgi:hypothetical protein